MKTILALGALLVTTTLAAQTQTDPRAQLAVARQQAQAARERSARMEGQARAAADQAERARAAQAAVAARIQAAEADIAAARARIALVDRQRRAQDRRLATRQQPIAELVAALQVMARRPAAAALVQPGSLDDLVHVRALLSTMAPRVAEQTAGLRAEVTQARALRTQATVALAALRDGQGQARIEYQRLGRLQVEERQRSARLAGSAQLESARAEVLGERTRDLEALVQALATEGSLRDRLASLPGPVSRPARLSNALPVEAVSPAREPRLAYRLPVLGPIARGFGEALPSGGRSRGVVITARAGSIVVAPGAGRITFAGLYRGYGAIAIIDHGDGYTSLVTGLASNIARIGHTVDQGGPLGRAGPDGVSVELRQAGQPVDLTTLIG